MPDTFQFIAADVAKAMLDLAASDGFWRTPNSLAGMASMISRRREVQR